jgi:hypothetical protein
MVMVVLDYFGFVCAIVLVVFCVVCFLHNPPRGVFSSYEDRLIRLNSLGSLEQKTTRPSVLQKCEAYGARASPSKRKDDDDDL